MDHGGMASDGSSCSTHMLWNWKVVDSCFLSESWQIKNDGMMAASCIGSALLVVLLEFSRRISREYDGFIMRQFQQHIAVQSGLAKAGAEENCCLDTGAAMPRTVTFRATPLQQLIRSFLHAVSFALAYIIMLLAMSFNGYLIVSIFLGAGLGKFICDWMIQKIVIDGDQQGRRVDATGDVTMCCG